MRIAPIALVVLLAACATAPVPVLETRAPASIAPAPTGQREAVARETGLPIARLVAIEEGFVAVQFDADDRLQLVWLRPSANGAATVILATLDEQRAQGSSITSMNLVICPDDVGLTRTRFVVGQLRVTSGLQMEGLPSVGGATGDGTYLFALAPSGGLKSSLTLTAGGRELATGDPMWMEQTGVAPGHGDRCSVAAG